MCGIATRYNLHDDTAVRDWGAHIRSLARLLIGIPKDSSALSRKQIEGAVSDIGPIAVLQLWKARAVDSLPRSSATGAPEFRG